MIEVEGICKTFGNLQALKEISFQAHDNQVLGLIGLNGAGKTTLLRILATEILPSSGDIRIDGRSIRNDGHHVRKNIGYLPDKPPLYPDMTIVEYLSFLAQLRGVSKPNQKHAIQRACEITQIDSYQNQYIGTLSHGFQQRVSIAQAIVHQPKILIFDEPTNGLDPLQILELRDLIVNLKSDHTILFSSHNLSEMTKISDRLLIIQNGRVVTNQKPSELTSTPTIKVRAQWSGEKDWSQILRPIPGVQHHTYREDQQVYTGTFECHTDCRPEIAATIVQHQGRLLNLERTEHEVEDALMRLIGENHG